MYTYMKYNFSIFVFDLICKDLPGINFEGSDLAWGGNTLHILKYRR